MPRKDSRIPSWVLALLFIFIVSMVGFGICKFVGNFIPFLILFGFSLIFAIDKWFYFILGRYKAIGLIYRIFLNLSILSTIGLIIWTGIKLFSMQFLQNSLIGSLIFIGELVFLIWLWRIVVKNSWRKPSMKLTVFTVLATAIIFAFAGVEPFSNFKDEVTVKIVNFISTQKEEAERRSAEAAVKETDRLCNLGISDPIIVQEVSKNDELKIGLEVVEKVNVIRKQRGSSELQWDNKLYEYSIAHARNMATQERLFHTDMNQPYAENAWGGEGSKHWTSQTIVDSWMDSKMHRTWLLCPNLRHVAVGIAYSNSGMYAAWTFWRSETKYSDWWYVDGATPPSWWY